MCTASMLQAILTKFNKLSVCSTPISILIHKLQEAKLTQDDILCRGRELCSQNNKTLIDCLCLKDYAQVLRKLERSLRARVGFSSGFGNLNILNVYWNTCM